MSHEFIDTDKMALPAPATGLGVWENVLVPDDGDERKAAILGAGVEALAERTTWLRHRGIITDPFGVTMPGLVNSGATVGASNSFVITKAINLSATVPPGASGYVAPVIWVTPSVPFIIDMAFIRLTGGSTASSAPGYAQLDLFLGADKLVTGLMSTYVAGVVAINGSTLNKCIFGIDPAEQGPLLSGTLTNSGKDSTGGASGNGKLLAYFNGLPPASYWAKQVTLRLTHGGVPSIDFTMPMVVTLAGRILG
ncbi:MAG: hypothetical protein ACMG6S_09525 [Byssovorax sp.]